MEGANWSEAPVKVFLPLCLPATTVTAIFAFINVWNKLTVTLAMPRSQESYSRPIQVFSLLAGRRTVK